MNPIVAYNFVDGDGWKTKIDEVKYRLNSLMFAKAIWLFWPQPCVRLSGENTQCVTFFAHQRANQASFVVQADEHGRRMMPISSTLVTFRPCSSYRPSLRLFVGQQIKASEPAS